MVTSRDAAFKRNAQKIREPLTLYFVLHLNYNQAHFYVCRAHGNMLSQSESYEKLLRKATHVRMT